MSETTENNSGEDETLDSFIHDTGPWYALLVNGIHREDLHNALTKALEATNRIHTERDNGKGGNTIDDVDEFARQILNGGNPHSIAGARIWKLHLEESSVEERIKDALKDIIKNDIKMVVINSILSLGANYREIWNALIRLFEGDVDVYIVETDTLITLDNEDAISGGLFTINLLKSEFDRQSQRRDLVRNAGEEATSHESRPGLGFTMENGDRVPDSNYDEVCAVLRCVTLPADHDQSMSKRQAAENLDCARRTITRALERAELYGLD